MRYETKKQRLLNVLGSLSNNKKGSILIPVLVIGTFLIIVTTALMARVSTVTNINKTMNYTENSYLAARSGITMLVDKSNSDASFAQKLFQSAYDDESTADSNPVVMDLGDLGKCNVSLVTTNTVTNDAGEVTGKEILAKCTGYYNDGNSFTLKRKLTITKTTTGDDSVSNVKPTAFQMFDDADISIAGGIDGDVLITGNGQLTSYGSTDTSPLHTVVCKNGFIFSSDSSIGYMYTLITGKSVATSQVAVDNDISCGMEGVNDSYVDMYTQAAVGGVIRCAGDVCLSATSRVAYKNIDTYGTKSNSEDDTLDHSNVVSSLGEGTAIVLKTGTSNQAIVSEGNVYLGLTFKKDSATNAAVKNSSGEYETEGNGGKYVYVYGDIIAQGDVYLVGNCRVYGDIYSGGTVYSQGGKVKGNIYCKSFKGTGTLAQLFSLDGSSKTIYAVDDVTDSSKKTDLTDAEKTNTDYHIVVGDAAKSVCQNKGIYDVVNSNAKSNFKSYTEGILTAPKTKIPTSTLVDGFSVNVDNLPVIKADTLSIVDGDSVLKQAFPATATGTNFTALYYQAGWTNMLYIKKSCVLEGDFQENMYIDTSALDQDIDIFVKGKVSTTGTTPWGTDWKGGIAINDDNGTHRVRIFLLSGSSMDISTGRGIWTVGDNVDYGHGILAEDVTQVEASLDFNPSNSYYDCEANFNMDYSKVGRYYIFAEDDPATGTYKRPELTTGTNGAIAGYVVAPSLNVNGPTSLGHQYKDGKEITRTSYPSFYGMLMCHKASFDAWASTWVKYDPRMVDPDTLGLTGDALTAAQTEYTRIHKQFSDDTKGIIVYDTTPTVTPGVVGTPTGTTTVWNVTME